MLFSRGYSYPRGPADPALTPRRVNSLLSDGQVRLPVVSRRVHAARDSSRGTELKCSQISFPIGYTTDGRLLGPPLIGRFTCSFSGFPSQQTETGRSCSRARELNVTGYRRGWVWQEGRCTLSPRAHGDSHPSKTDSHMWHSVFDYSRGFFLLF